MSKVPSHLFATIHYRGRGPAGRMKVRIALMGPVPKPPPSAVSIVRIPIEIKDEAGRTVRKREAAGILAPRQPVLLTADLTLPPGRYQARRPREEASFSFSFTLASRHPYPINLFCQHGGRRPSIQKMLSVTNLAGDPLLESSERFVNRCCEKGTRLPRPKTFNLAIVRAVGRVQTLRVDGRVVRLAPDDYLIVNPRGRVDLVPDCFPLHERVLSFSQETLRTFRDAAGIPLEKGPFDFAEDSRPMTPRLAQLIAQVESAMRESHTLENPYASTLASHQLLLHLLKTHPNSLQKKHASAVPESLDLGPALTVAVQYLETYYDKPCSVDRVARVAGVSATFLRRLFRRHLGQSPLGYLQKIRIEKAKSLLQDRANTLEKVAHAVGYQNVRSFQRLFRARTKKKIRAFRVH